MKTILIIDYEKDLRDFLKARSKNLAIIFLGIFFFFILSTHNVYAYTYYSQKKASIQRALENKPDLTGKTKRDIVIQFGQPVFKKVIPSEENNKEAWMYKPFRLGQGRIDITFTDGVVSEVIYSGE